VDLFELLQRLGQVAIQPGNRIEGDSELQGALKLAADNRADQPGAVGQLGLDRAVEGSDGGGADRHHRGGDHGHQYSDQSGAEASTVQAAGHHGAPSRVADSARPAAR
jgi:hypothetical protein